MNVGAISDGLVKVTWSVGASTVSWFTSASSRQSGEQTRSVLRSPLLSFRAVVGSQEAAKPSDSEVDLLPGLTHQETRSDECAARFSSKIITMRDQ